jgi:outer membrane protein insertion porin family
MAPPRCFASACILLSLSLARAADIAPQSEYEGKPIQEIRFEPQSQPVSRADLARLLDLKPGTPLRLAGVREAIKRLYSTGRYSALTVEAEPAGNGVTLVIRTAEQWFVGPVEVRGKVNAPPNDGQLANAASLELGAPFEEDDLQNAVKGMNDLLQRNGLYLGAINPDIERDSEHQQVAFTFSVQSGKRARFVLPIVTGETRIPPEDLAKAAKYKGWWFFRWKYATEDNTQSGLRAIRGKYEKEDRYTAAVTLDRMEYLPGQNRVRPHIEADGGPKIKIATEGAKLSKKKLEMYVPVFDEATVNRDLLVRGVGNLRDYFQGKGYFDVRADFSSRQVDPDHEEITYLIALGERHKVVRLEVQGNRYFTAGEIRERMFLQPAGFIRLRHGRYSKGFADRDEDAIEALYKANGFRDVKVTMAMVDDYQGKAGDVAVTVSIDEGPQYTVSALDVDGITRPDREQIVSRLASIPGQPFSASNVALDRDYLIDAYQSAGYPDVSFDWRMAPGAAPEQVSVRYIISEGQPRYVRDVLLSGLRHTSARLVNPNVLLQSGDPLSWTRMGEMQRRLYELGIFDKVEMAVQNPQGNTENKYVLFHFTEGRRYYVAVGAGAEIARIGGSQTSLNNPAGATGFAPRGNVEFSRLNLWGLGHSLNFKSRYSTLDRRFSLNYLAPRYRNVDGRNISVTALYDNTRDVLTFTARRLEGSAQISQRLSKPTTVFWRYTYRDVRVDKTTLKINPLLIPQVAQPARIGMFDGNLVQDRRDDPTNAHRGIYNSLDAGLVDHFFGGNKNFFRFLGRNSYYKTFRSDYVIASNTMLGWIRPFGVASGTDLFNYVPLPERFFGGGSTSHRGFPDNQAGPRDELTGFPLGGNALLFHSTELRFPFLGENINGVLFHDMGNVYSGLKKISFRVHQKNLQDFDYMVHAVGFGIRYHTPVGPVRLDLAYSINPPTFNGLKGTYQQLLFGGATPTVQSVRHFQFFFSIGQAF